MDLLADNFLSIVALIFALIILMKNREGWGWFLFAAVVMASSGAENRDKEGAYKAKAELIIMSKDDGISSQCE